VGEWGCKRCWHSERKRSRFLSGMKYDGGTYFRQQENPVMMKTLAIDYLWDSDPKHRETWREALRQLWEDDKLVRSDRS